MRRQVGLTLMLVTLLSSGCIDPVLGAGLVAGGATGFALLMSRNNPGKKKGTTEVAPPSAYDLERFPEQSRAGIACRMVNGYFPGRLCYERQRATADDRITLGGPKFDGQVKGLMRPVFLPDPLPEGNGVSPLVNLTATGNTRKAYVEPGWQWTFPVMAALGKGTSGLRELRVKGLTAETLADSRRSSEFHAPVRGSLGPRECWGIGDAFSYYGKSYVTAEIYLSDPRGTPTPEKPDHVLVLSEGPAGPNCRHELCEASRRAQGDVRRTRDVGLPFYVGGRAYRFVELQQEGGKLLSFKAVEWQPSVDEVIAGRTECLHQAMPPDKAERSMNDLLLEWKTKGLPDRLRGATIEALQDFCIQLEKSILMHDQRGKKWNDAAEAKIAKGEDASSDREVATLLAQRKTILLAILKTAKAALEARQRGR